jgi:hypothetical protein
MGGAEDEEHRGLTQAGKIRGPVSFQKRKTSADFADLRRLNSTKPNLRKSAKSADDLLFLPS